MNLRLLLPVLAFAWGIGLSVWPLQAQVLALLAPGVLLPALLRNRRQELKLLLICLVTASLGLAWAILRQPHPGERDISLHIACKRCQVLGEVQSIQVSDKRLQLRLKVSQLITQGKSQSVTGLLQVSLAQQHTAKRPATGDRVRLSGALKQPLPALNFGAFSYRDYLARQGVFAQFQAQDLQFLTAPHPWYPPFLLERFRRHIFTGFAQALSPEHAALLGSLVLGEQEAAVTAEIKNLFQQAGLQHVLAVSGFQVQLLLLACLGLARLVRLPRVMAAICGTCITLLYVALTGFSASVMRAGIVACLGLLAWACFRRIHALQALVVGGGLLLFLRPGLLFEVGFQFSFLATAGLIWGATWLAEKLDFLPLPLATCLGALLAAQLWVLPVQLYHFGAVSLLVIPANLWATLFVSLLTWMTLAGMILALFLGGIWAFFAPFLGFVTAVFIGGVAWLAALPIPALTGIFPSGMQVTFALLILIALPHLHLQVFAKKRWRPFFVIVLAIPLLGWSSLLQARQSCPVRVTYLYVGQGDAILIEAAGQTLLIDAGPRQEQGEQVWDAGTRFILPYLQRRGIKRIDNVILSHAHLDHFGGLSGILAEIPVKNIWVPAESPSSSAYLDLLSRIQIYGANLLSPRSGQQLFLSPELKLTFWQGLAESGPDESHGVNNQSLVVQLKHQDLTFLFAGDVEAEAEQALLEQLAGRLKADIFKIPHHGSDTSSSEAFLAAIKPREAIVSVGINNRFHHPVPEVLARYQSLGTRVWRTDQQGAVCVCSQGKAYQISSVQAAMIFDTQSHLSRRSQ
jgi:competence protein ComEC